MKAPPLNNEIEAWVTLFRRDERAALLALLHGSVPLGSLTAAEPEDAMATIAGLHPDDDEFHRSIDRGCQSLLEEYRRELLQKQGPEFGVELSRLSHLVTIIRRLLPEETVVDLHRRFYMWSGFFENFVVDRSLDLRREFFRTLALSQDLAANAGFEPRRLMPLWLSICAESADLGLYDQSYLRVALLGLRRLPLGEDLSSNEDFTLQGLARWAVSQRPPESKFEREWRILEGDFPRSPSFWSSRVEYAIHSAERELAERTHGQETTFPLAAWWRQDVELHPGHAVSQQSPNREPPHREVREKVLRNINAQYPLVASQVEALVRAHKAYADLTGDVFYLVRTACNVGMRMIEHGDPTERRVRGSHAVSLAALAFNYDPTNVYAWSLMMRALALAGRASDAELVGWEAVRRFPENRQWRTQLATIIAEYLNNPAEAVVLLRETAAIFPDDPFARCQLATVLADDLRETETARKVLEAAVEDGAASEVTHLLLGKLLRQKSLRKSPLVPPTIDESRLSIQTARARQILFRFETDLVDQSAVRSLLSEVTSDGYTTYVADRTGASNLPFKTTFAMAFDEALVAADPSALRALIAQSRPLERALIERAIATSGDTVVMLKMPEGGGSQVERLSELDKLLEQDGVGGQQRRVRMLRDFAASTLCIDTTLLAAA